MTSLWRTLVQPPDFPFATFQKRSIIFTIFCLTKKDRPNYGKLKFTTIGMENGWKIKDFPLFPTACRLRIYYCYPCARSAFYSHSCGYAASESACDFTTIRFLCLSQSIFRKHVLSLDSRIFLLRTDITEMVAHNKIKKFLY